jgi:hypothetical protein
LYGGPFGALQDLDFGKTTQNSYKVKEENRYHFRSVVQGLKKYITLKTNRLSCGQYAARSGAVRQSRYNNEGRGRVKTGAKSVGTNQRCSSRTVVATLPHLLKGNWISHAQNLWATGETSRWNICK